MQWRQAAYRVRPGGVPVATFCDGQRRLAHAADSLASQLGNGLQATPPAAKGRCPLESTRTEGREPPGKSEIFFGLKLRLPSDARPRANGVDGAAWREEGRRRVTAPVTGGCDANRTAGGARVSRVAKRCKRGGVPKSKQPLGLNQAAVCEGEKNPGGDLLSHAKVRSIIGDGGLNFRVRKGIGCTPASLATREIYKLK